MEYEILKKNLKYLRISHGMTQKDLSEKLGYDVDSSNPVKDWEIDRVIPDVKIDEIANLFNISKYALKTIDLEEVIKLCSYELNNFEEFLKKLFPYKIEEEYLKNENFFNAYEIHKKILSLDIEDNIYEMAKESYNNYALAYEAGIKESAVNLLSISCLYKHLTQHCDFEINEKEIANLPNIDSLSDFQALNENIRRNIIKKITIYNSPSKLEEVEGFISETSDIMLYLLLIIKKGLNEVELSEYYIAIMYIYNLIDTGYQKSDNYLFGQIYLELLCKLENSYAINLINRSENSN